MLIPREDGVLEWRPDPPPIVLNAHTTEHTTTLENGVVIRMVCQWGEIVTHRDPRWRAPND